MSEAVTTSAQIKKGPKSVRPILQLRFESEEHYNLVRKVAKLQGRSMNSWLIRATRLVATKQLQKREQRDAVGASTSQ